MVLRDYVRAIRKRWWVVVLVTVLGGLAGGAALVTATPQYVSSITFYVATTAGSSTSGQANDADQFAQRRATSYAELLSSDKVANAVLASGGIPLTTGAVAARITGTVDINTVLLRAAVQDSDKARTLKIAQALADKFPDVVTELDSSATSGTTDSGTDSATPKLSVVSGPTVPQSPVSPRPSLYVGLGVLVGLLLGLAAAVLRERFDTTVRSDEALATVSDLPIIGSVPLDSTARTSPLVWGERSRTPRAEIYRRLRTNLQFVDVDEPIRVIVVTSSVAEEGKSSTSANLALSFADAGKSVVLIEGDLRRPRVADFFEMERSVGLTNVLVGQVDLGHVLQPFGDTGLFVLPSGSIPPNPSELLGSRNMGYLLERLKERFDLVVIDAPPVLPVTDAAVVSTLADGVAFIVRHGHTKRAQVASALRALEAVDARLLGFVLNMVPVKRSAAYGTYGRYDSYGSYNSLTGTGALETFDVNVDLSKARPASKLAPPPPRRAAGTRTVSSPGTTETLTPDEVSGTTPPAP